MQTTIVADGNGPTITHKGGAGSLYARGTFGGGTLKLQYLPNGDAAGTAGNWIDVANATLTAAGVVNFCLPVGSVRVVMTGSTTPSVAHDIVGTIGRAASG